MKVAIVDAYSTGNQICQRLAEKDVKSFHIQSSTVVPKLLEKSYRKTDFDINFIYDGDWNTLLNDVATQAPTHVIAGSETGVLLADKISHALNLVGNDFTLSEARRNKYLMLNAVKNAGLSAAWQFKENNLEELLSKLTENNFPVVIKPLSSSSSDGFHICQNEFDVRTAYNNIMGSLNILEEPNNAVLCQSFLKGVQYIVNSVSCHGKHYITDIWEMQHRHINNVSMVIDSMTLLPSSHKIWQVLVEYIKDVLAALGISFGAAHTEIMLTENGPSLIEVNARLMGGNIDSCFKEALGGYDQIDALIDSIVAPDELNQRLKQGYHTEAFIAEIDFIFYKKGILLNFIKENEIRKLNTFRKFSKMPALGSHVNKTNNTTNTEGLLYLIDKDFSKVIADRDTVVGWQRNDLLFEIEELLCEQKIS